MGRRPQRHDAGSVAVHSTGAPLVERLAGEDAHRAPLRIRAAHIEAQTPRRRRAATTCGLFSASARPAWSRGRSRTCPSSSATGATRTAWPRQRMWSSRPSRLCSTTTQGWPPIPRAVGAPSDPRLPPPGTPRPPRLGSGMCMVATMCTLCSGRCAPLRPRAWGAVGRCSSSRLGSPPSVHRRWVGGGGSRATQWPRDPQPLGGSLPPLGWPRRPCQSRTLVHALPWPLTRYTHPPGRDPRTTTERVAPTPRRCNPSG